MKGVLGQDWAPRRQLLSGSPGSRRGHCPGTSREEDVMTRVQLRFPAVRSVATSGCVEREWPGQEPGCSFTSITGLSYQKNAFPYINKGKTQVKQVGPGTTSLVLYVLALHCPLSLKCRH